MQKIGTYLTLFFSQLFILLKKTLAYLILIACAIFAYSLLPEPVLHIFGMLLITWIAIIVVWMGLGLFAILTGKSFYKTWIDN
jgi:hypothetical protein